MKRYGWPRPPILIAVVLADIVEKYLWLSANSYGWSMFARPQFLSIIVVMIVVMVVSLRMQQGAKEGGGGIHRRKGRNRDWMTTDG